MFVKKVAVFICLILLIACFAGCEKNVNTFEGEDIETKQKGNINLVYYSIGIPDKELRIVNDELNRILANRIGVTIDFRKVAWDEYEDHIASLINSGRQIDIAFSPNYATTALEGKWLELNAFLEHEGKEMHHVIHNTFWDGVTINGKIYGVPTNKELSVMEQWIFSKEMVEKYNVNLDEYQDLQSLEKLFKLIKLREPEYVVMELDRTSRNFFTQYGYEYITDRNLPFMVKSDDPDSEIVNIFETEEAKNIIDILRSYYLKGYINEDAATYNSSSFTKHKKVFFRQAGGGPFSQTIWSEQRGYPVVAVPVSDKVVTNESTRGGVTCININTKYPSEAVKILNCINTDSEVRNTMNYGIAGKHYELDKNEQVINMRQDLYAGVTYAEGNWFILKTQNGLTPEPVNKWEQYQEFNDSTVRSILLGFAPDLSELSYEIRSITKVMNTFYSPIMTGSVDVDEFLPQFNNELRKAGINKVRDSLQDQIRKWKSANN